MNIEFFLCGLSSLKQGLNTLTSCIVDLNLQLFLWALKSEELGVMVRVRVGGGGDAGGGVSIA